MSFGFTRESFVSSGVIAAAHYSDYQCKHPESTAAWRGLIMLASRQSVQMFSPPSEQLPFRDWDAITNREEMISLPVGGLAHHGKGSTN